MEDILGVVFCLDAPLTRLPDSRLVWLDGSPSTTVDRVPSREIADMRLVIAPVTGPHGWLNLPTLANRRSRTALAALGHVERSILAKGKATRVVKTRRKNGRRR